MPWYQVIKRIIGTALPEGGRVPNETWGFGIVRMSEVVNATAFPVPVNTPNPVYARYLAWLATPQGQSVSRQIAAAAVTNANATTPSTAGGRTSRVPTGAILGLLLALAVVAAVLGVAVNRRRKRGGRIMDTLAAQALLDPSLPPLPEQDELLTQEREELLTEAGPQARVFFGVDPQPAHVHMIRPYVSGADGTAADIANRSAFDR